MSAWHWPQWVVAIFLATMLSIRPMNIAQRKGASRAFVDFAFMAFSAWVLWCGGFW